MMRNLAPTEELERAMEQKLKLDHRADKSEQRKHTPDPKPTTDDDSSKAALDLLDRASDLIKQREAEQNAQEIKNQELPLLSPGKKYPASFVSNGYRVEDGYLVSYNHDGDVRVANKRKPPFEKGKINTILTACEDGGIPWVYYNSYFENGEGLNLSQCMIRHGLGGWHDKERDIRCKVIFTDADRSYKPGKCFILFMERPKAKGHVLVKGQELNKDVVRIYRSAVPPHIERAIGLRELINFRQGGGVAGFWNW